MPKKDSTNSHHYHYCMLLAVTVLIISSLLRFVDGFQFTSPVSFRRSGSEIIKHHQTTIFHTPVSEAGVCASTRTSSSSLPSTTSSSLGVLDLVDHLITKNPKSFSNDSILKRVHGTIEADYKSSLESSIVVEVQNKNRIDAVTNRFEWMDGHTNLVLQSVEPIFTQNEIASIRSAAEELWRRNHDDSGTSRFTYQYPGNSEAHVSDLKNMNAVTCINHALQEKIYPMIRDNFWNSNQARSNDENSILYVYDALIIRYNATASASGAGQPLHRDLGLVSVNIMLNDDNQFEGGGTAFENDIGTGPRKPSRGAGHCLAHKSSERHAGAATYKGVRDILVFFVAGMPSNELKTAYLKKICRDDGNCIQSDNNANTDELSILCRIKHYRLAIEVSGNDDGESYLYMGTALMELAELYNSQTEQTKENVATILEASIGCFQQAQNRIPNDSRVYNNLGISLSRLLGHKMQNQLEWENKQLEKYQFDNIDASIQESYQRGLDLLIKSSSVGCNVENDLDSLTLNYGLYLANRDEFEKACNVLARLAAKEENDTDKSKTIKDAIGLFHFCDRQVQGTEH